MRRACGLKRRRQNFPCNYHQKYHEVMNKICLFEKVDTGECCSFPKSGIEECEVLQLCQSHGDGETLGKIDKKDTDMAKREALHRTVALSTNNKRHVVILNRDAEKNISLIQIISQCSM